MVDPLSYFLLLPVLHIPLHEPEEKCNLKRALITQDTIMQFHERSKLPVEIYPLLDCPKGTFVINRLRLSSSLLRMHK